MQHFKREGAAEDTCFFTPEMLSALTPEPIKDTRYQDRSIKPGVTYVYAIVAVDRATPPNRSAASNRVQETAR